MSSKDISKQQKLDVTTDLIRRVASIETEHNQFNADIDTPYHQYMVFNQKVAQMFTPEDISRILDHFKTKKPANGTIPLVIIANLAYNQLRTQVENFENLQH